MAKTQFLRRDETENESVQIRPVGWYSSNDPLVKDFFSDPIFVEATKEGVRAHQAGEIGIFLDELRREVSESHQDDKTAG